MLDLSINVRPVHLVKTDWNQTLQWTRSTHLNPSSAFIALRQWLQMCFAESLWHDQEPNAITHREELLLLQHCSTHTHIKPLTQSGFWCVCVWTCVGVQVCSLQSHNHRVQPYFCFPFCQKLWAILPFYKQCLKNRANFIHMLSHGFMWPPGAVGWGRFNNKTNKWK